MLTGPLRANAAAVALLAATALLFLAQLGQRGLVSEEVRWATVAREMLASGDYFHPTLNGRGYYDKPLGSYWLIVAASPLTGGQITETTARLPAALAGVLAVGLLVSLARRLTDGRTALLAGAVLATSFSFVVYARRATADIETVAGVVAAVSLYHRQRDKSGGPWVLALWAVMAATSLTKGLLGFALPLAVMGVDTLLRWRHSGRAAAGWLLTPWTLAAVPLAVAAYLAPFLLSAGGGSGVSTADGLAMVWRENVQRFVAPHNHKGPPYLYAGVVFLLAAPWSAFLPAALVPPRVKALGDRFARVVFWTVFAFFTFSASRRSYYLLPVLPAAALLIAMTLTAPAENLRPVARRLRRGGWLLTALGTVAAGLALVPPAWVLPAPLDALPPLPYPWLYAAGWLAAVAALGLAAAGKLPRPAVAVAVTFAGFAYAFGLAWPHYDDQRTRRGFLTEVHDATDAAPHELAAFHARDAVFDFGRTVADYPDAADLELALRRGDIRWVLTCRRYAAAVTLPATIAREEAVRPWDGPDQVGDKLVLLEAVR